VYREIQQKYPNQVAAVIMHKVNKTVAPERVAGMSLVENYAQATAVLHRAGLLTQAQARKVIGDARVEGLALTEAQVAALLG